jgi:hypothetical protein
MQHFVSDLQRSYTEFYSVFIPEPTAVSDDNEMIRLALLDDEGL